VLGIVGMLAVGAAVLLASGRLRGRQAPLLQAAAGSLVLAACVIPVMEFESDVPQFAMLWYLPVLTAGVAFALALIDAAGTGRWSATGAAAIYTVLRAGVWALLAGIGFSTPIVPPVLVAAVAFDVARRRGLPPLARAPIVAVAIYAAYVPAIAMGTPARITGADVAVGLPIAAFAALLAMALVQVRPPRRPPTLAAAAAITVAVLALLPTTALAHDPGQGTEVGQARLTAVQSGLVSSVTGRLEGGAACDRLADARLVARRGGAQVTAPLRQTDPCQVRGTIRLPSPGRWFVYVDLQSGGRPLEAWIPVQASPAANARFVRTASLYVPPTLSGSPVETVAAVALYGLDLLVVLAVALTVRRAGYRPNMPPAAAESANSGSGATPCTRDPAPSQRGDHRRALAPQISAPSSSSRGHPSGHLAFNLGCPSNRGRPKCLQIRCREGVPLVLLQSFASWFSLTLVVEAWDAAGRRTHTLRPPPSRGNAWTSPPWAWATDRTMDSPRPAPRLVPAWRDWASRSLLGRRWKGWNRPGTS
jgi:hypothetical protein